MYRVQIQNVNEQPLTIHDSQINGNKVSDGVVTREVNAIDTFSFGVGPENEGYTDMKPFQTKISVFNTIAKRFEFKGRVLDFEEKMDDVGNLTTSFLCESIAAYLHDSKQRHLEFRGSLMDLITTIINYHNTQVESYKHFKIGTVTVTDPNDYVYIYLSAEQSTWETLQDKLVDRLGGEISVREEADGLYIDYLVETGGISDVEIRLAKNLVSNTKKVDLTQIVSRLKPLGERLESEDADATDASEARLTIESVNGGKDYIDRADLIQLVGIRAGSQVWDDVTQASNLLSKGRDWLNKQKTIFQQMHVSALDLSIIGLEYDSFQLGYYHRLVNPIMAIDETIRIIGMQIHLDTPESNTLTIGDKFKTLADYNRESLERDAVVNRLRDRVNAQSRKIGTLSNQLAAANETVGHIQTSLQDVDIENLPFELQGISNQLLGLQGTLDEIEQAIDLMPVYLPATTTTDGLMSSVDKVSLDNVATDMGDLSLLNTIDKTSIVSSINELVTRIETLENTP